MTTEITLKGLSFVVREPFTRPSIEFLKGITGATGKNRLTSLI
jgi:hypothetical protein